MYSLYSDCLPVRGYSRSIIYDFHKNKYYYIPNDLYDLLVNYKSTEDWFKSVPICDHKVLDEYIYFLKQNNCVFKNNNQDFACLPLLDIKWESPDKISVLNLICSRELFTYQKELITFIQNLYIHRLCLHVKLPSKYLSSFLALLKDTWIVDVELILDFQKYKEFDFNKLILRYSYIRSVVFYNAPEEKMQYMDNNHLVTFYFITGNVKNSINYSVNFIVNIKFYMEAQKYNTYYNKRIFIDQYGFVRNNLKGLVLGHIVNKEVVNHEQIKLYWNINKNIIEHCKICEHRYMCYDSRIPVFDNKKWYYKTDCGYNPYSCKWKWEDGFKALKEYQ